LWNTIDWNGMEGAYKESKLLTHLWGWQKHIQFFGHLKNRNRWQYRSVSNCLHCGKLVDKAHISQCQQDSTTETWEMALKKLKQWFQVSNTANAIFVVLSPVAQQCLGECLTTCTKCFGSEALGWDWLLEGWVAQSWREYQEQCWPLSGVIAQGNNGWQSWLRSCGMFHGTCGPIEMEFCTTPH